MKKNNEGHPTNFDSINFNLPGQSSRQTVSSDEKTHPLTDSDSPGHSQNPDSDGVIPLSWLSIQNDIRRTRLQFRQGLINEAEMTQRIADLRNMESSAMNRLPSMDFRTTGKPIRNIDGRQGTIEIISPSKKKSRPTEKPRALFNRIFANKINFGKPVQVETEEPVEETGGPLIIDEETKQIINEAIREDPAERQLAQVLIEAREANRAKGRILPMQPGDKYTILGGQGYFGRDTAVITQEGLGICAVLPGGKEASPEKSPFDRIITFSQIKKGDITLEVAPGGRKIAWFRRLAVWLPDLGTIVVHDRRTGGKFEFMGVLNPHQVIDDINQKARMEEINARIRNLVTEHPQLLESNDVNVTQVNTSPVQTDEA